MADSADSRTHFIPDAVIDDDWHSWRQHTRARIALGRTGAALPTDELLAFGVAHAQARDAIHTPLDGHALAQQIEHAGWTPVHQVSSQAPDRLTYLRRPDLGRALSPNAILPCIQADIVLVVADGLSSLAVQRHTLPVLQALAHLDPVRWQNVPVVLARQARVALGDPIGQVMGARLVVLFIGERPGLSSPDSLGCYITYQPAVGRNDAERNCISNIRPEGLDYPVAAFKLNWLVDQAISRQLTGVNLKDESDLLLAQQPTSAIE